MKKVGQAGTMPGTGGFTMAVFHASEVPVGTNIYIGAPSDESSDLPQGWPTPTRREYIDEQHGVQPLFTAAQVKEIVKSELQRADQELLDIFAPIARDAKRYRFARESTSAGDEDVCITAHDWTDPDGEGDILVYGEADAFIDDLMERSLGRP